MSEPFAYLDEEEEVAETATSIAWLPITLAGVAVTGFLMVPVLGLLKPDNKPADWANYDQEDSINVGFEAAKSDGPVVDSLEPLASPNPVVLTEDLASVDETLASLGANYAPKDRKTGSRFGVEHQASSFMPGKKAKPNKVKKPTSKRSITSRTASRSIALHEPDEKNLAANADRVSATQPKPQPGAATVAIARPLERARPNEIARIKPAAQPNAAANKIGRIVNVKEPVDPPAQTRPQPVRVMDQPVGPVILRPTSPVHSFPTTVTPYPAAIEPVIASSTAHPALTPVSNPAKSRDVPAQSAPAAGTYAPQVLVTSPVPTTQPQVQVPYDIPAVTKQPNPLDKWGHVIAYRVQSFDNINKIADAHATTPEQLIELNGRASTRKGEMIVVPVDNCLIKNGN